MAKVNWEDIRSEYITKQVSYFDLADKYGLSRKTVSDRGLKGEWVKARKKYREMVANKAIRKMAAKQTGVLERELRLAAEITAVLERALSDSEQFNRHIVQIREKNGKIEHWDAEERQFSKVDMKALRDAAETLAVVEKMKRSLMGIMTVQESAKQDLDQRRVAIAEEHLLLEQKKMEMGHVMGDQDGLAGGIIILPERIEDDTEPVYELTEQGDQSDG